MSLEKEWLGYICEILSSKNKYVDTKKKVLIEGIPMLEKTVSTSDQVITWHEDYTGELLNVSREYI